MIFNSATERLLHAQLIDCLPWHRLQGNSAAIGKVEAVMAYLANADTDPWAWPKPVREAMASDTEADILVCPLCTALCAIACGEAVSRETLASLRNRLKHV